MKNNDIKKITLSYSKLKKRVSETFSQLFEQRPFYRSFVRDTMAKKTGLLILATLDGDTNLLVLNIKQYEKAMAKGKIPGNFVYVIDVYNKKITEPNPAIVEHLNIFTTVPAAMNELSRIGKLQHYMPVQFFTFQETIAKSA